MRTLTLLALLAASVLADSAQAQIAPERRCTLVSTVATSGPMPAQGAIGGLAVDAQHRIHVATFRSDVWRVEIDGTKTLLSNEFVNASGCAMAANGDLLQADYVTNRVYRVHPDGTRTLFASGFTKPVGVAIAPSGEVYVLNYGNDTISHVTAGGVVSLFSTSPELNGPNGIAINDAGEVFVVNLKDNKVLEVAVDGTATVLATGPGGNAHVVCMNDRLYVSSIFSHVVYEVALDGTTALVAGTGSKGMLDGCVPDAKLSYPNGIAASPDGKLLYTNNFTGLMGGAGGKIWVRSIRIP